MLLYADYRTLVIQEYQKKRAANCLHSGLVEPSCARLKEACLATCINRYNPKDKRTLEEYFGQGGDKAACLKAIERLDAEKFKAFSNFLNDLNIATKRKNIELLAWLVDFTPRPFVFDELPDMDIQGTRGEEPIKEKLKEEEEEEESTEPETPVQEERKDLPDQKGPDGRPRKKRIVMALLATIIVVGAGIGLYRSKTGEPEKLALSLTSRGACMFWNEDHYQPISCQQHGDTLVIPFDSATFLHFRKITRPDTITPNAKGSVWYIRYRGNYEYYTAGGLHPIDPQLRLRPLTDFIIIHHIPANP
jgi:hypothetical protein